MFRDPLDPATAHCCAPWSTERIGISIGVARGVATCVAMANGRGCGWSSAKTPLWSAHVGGGGGGVVVAQRFSHLISIDLSEKRLFSPHFLSLSETSFLPSFT